MVSFDRAVKPKHKQTMRAFLFLVFGDYVVF